MPIRVVNIDDASLSKIGQWPWPRTVIAQLIDKLRRRFGGDRLRHRLWPSRTVPHPNCCCLCLPKTGLAQRKRKSFWRRYPIPILALPRIRALPSAVLGGTSVAVAFGTSWLLFKHAHLLIDPVYPWAEMTLVYLVATLLGHLRTETRQRQIRGAFSQYMSPHYVNELAAHPERLKLGGQARNMTIMFCDIRGFTSLSEKLDAESLTHFMNSFLSPMTEIIIEQIEAPPANWDSVFTAK